MRLPALRAVTGRGKVGIQHMRDLLQSVRGLRKSPGFTATAVLALAVGIGSTSSIFSLLDAVMLRPLPFPDAGRLVMISERPPGFGRNVVSPPPYLDWKA